MKENRFYFNSRRPAGQPARGWLGYLVVLPVLAVALVLGFFFFAAILALFSIVTVVLLARFWWLRRGLRRDASRTQTVPRAKGGALEGEYIVITEEKREVRR